jgi:signal transduction histidine kinase
LKKYIDEIKGLGSRVGPIPGSLANSACLCLILAVAYFLLGKLAFSMAISEGSATSVAFLPEGIALAFAILFGPRIAPGIFIGQFVLSLSLGVPAGVGASFGLVNMMEDSLGGILFWRLKISPAMERPRDIAMFFGLSALVLQPLGALFKAVPRLAIAPPDAVMHLSIFSWAGNTMGQFLITPLILTWCCSAFRADAREMRRALLIVGGYFLVLLAFKISRLGETDRLYWLAIFAAFYLTLIWSAVRSRPQITTTVNLLMTMGILWMITSSPDSLLYFSTQDRVLYADVLIMGGVLTALLVSALFGQLIERTAQLKEANAAKEKIFAVIGHDLRSPLASIVTTLELMKTGDISQEEFREFQADLHAGVHSARWTLENLMEWGTSQMNAIQRNASDVRMFKIVADTIDLLSLQSEAKGIRVENLVPSNAVVSADRHQMASVIRNLLSNALKFTPAGGVITLRAVRKEAFWQFTVQDSGVGMHQSTIEALLRRNGQVGSTLGTANEKGLGLGLLIFFDFVEVNGGTFGIESSPGHGSTFAFTVPAVREIEEGVPRKSS